MSKLRETYKWIDEFNDKKLTAPPGGTRFIEIAFDGEVKALFSCFFLSSVCLHVINKSAQFSFAIQKCENKVQEHAQLRTTLPFARTECFAANFIDVKQLINNDDIESIKDVYELTLQIKVCGGNFLINSAFYSKLFQFLSDHLTISLLHVLE